MKSASPLQSSSMALHSSAASGWMALLASLQSPAERE